MFNYSINHMTILTLVLVAVIPIVSFGAYSIEDERKSVERQKLDFLSEIIHQQQTRANDFFTERISDISVSAKLPFVQQHIPILFNDDLEDKSESILILTEQLKNILDVYRYETIWVVDNNFDTKLVVGRNIGEIKPFELPHFANDLSLMPYGAYLSDVYPGNFGAPSELFVSIPIIVNETLFGYLVYDVDLETFFKDTLLELKQSKTGEIVLVQAQYDETFFIKKLRFDDSLPFSKVITLNNALAIPALESASGISGSGYSIDYRGKEILAVWDYIPLTRWGVVAKIDTSEAFATIDQKQNDVGIIVISLAAIAFIVGWGLNRISTKPLFKLNEVALKVSQKDYGARMPSSNLIEYKTISKIFNEMVQSLQSSEKLTKQHFNELRKIDIQKGEFAAMASHELKTPLVPIKGYLEMLLEQGLVGTLSPKQTEMLKKIYENTESMEKLVLRLLTAQRLDLGKMGWTISEFNVLDLMNDVYSDNNSLMDDGKKIVFTNHTKDSKIISSDYDQIKEIFSNLIVNAVDFVPVNGTIEINAITKDDSVIFSIKDNGTGMSIDEQKGLFKKFYQVDTSVTRKHGGTGLGLAICKGLVEGLGGKIWVESKTGKGATFYFTIPVDYKRMIK